MVGFGWWGCAKKGLSVDDEKQQKARRRDVSRFEQDMPERVPHILEKGSDKVAYDILKRLADGPRRPAELRAALGISSVNFFTALPDAACEVGLHRGCWRREESLSAQQAVQDSAQGKGGDLCLTPPLYPTILTLGVSNRRLS